MAGMQETDHLTLKNGITYLLQDSKVRAQLAAMLAEVMEKYGADNPPPYPVTSVNGQTGDVQIQTGGAVDSVNGQTGAVVLDAADVGALPDTTQIPSKTSDLTNDSGFVNAAAAAAAAPVQSVNGQTGAVTVAVPTATSDLTNDSGFVDAAGAAAAAPVQSVNGQTGAVTVSVPVQSVNGKTGAVVLDADDVGAATPNDSGSGYCKMPDGTLIQWGAKELTSGSTSSYSPLYILTTGITFPIPFIDDDYRLFGSGKFGTGAALAFGQESGTASIGTVRVFDVAPRTLSSSMVLRIQWTAIGRWK